MHLIRLTTCFLRCIFAVFIHYQSILLWVAWSAIQKIWHIVINPVECFFIDYIWIHVMKSPYSLFLCFMCYARIKRIRRFENQSSKAVISTLIIADFCWRAFLKSIPILLWRKHYTLNVWLIFIQLGKKDKHKDLQLYITSLKFGSESFPFL